MTLLLLVLFVLVSSVPYSVKFEYRLHYIFFFTSLLVLHHRPMFGRYRYTFRKGLPYLYQMIPFHLVQLFSLNIPNTMGLFLGPMKEVLFRSIHRRFLSSLDSYAIRVRFQLFLASAPFSSFLQLLM